MFKTTDRRSTTQLSYIY